MSAAATALARKPSETERKLTQIALQRLEEQGWERDAKSDQFVYLEALEHRADERDARIAALENKVQELQQIIARLASGSVVVGPGSDRVCARNSREDLKK